MATVQEYATRIAEILPETLPYELPRKGIAKFLHWAVISVLNKLPKKTAQLLFVFASGRGEETRTVFNGATTYEALEVMYTFPRKRALGKATLSGRVWWSLLDNARSIWNRLLVVKHELRFTIGKVLARGEQVRLLSIGSGSARPVLETVCDLSPDTPIQVMLIDQDQKAIHFSKELAQELHLNGTVEFVMGNFLKLIRRLTFQPNIVEMVGLLDYLEDRLAILLLKEIFHVLEPGGWLITGNIAPNHERRFVERGINWLPMHHRTETQLKNLLFHAGFEEPRIQREPLSIHIVAVTRKPG
ncbi:MAG: class I SAM-dependent methyltransferase family protein [bacterium]|nr:class I SAM-dependent methyltransferase family protein [bacterium]